MRKASFSIFAFGVLAILIFFLSELQRKNADLKNEVSGLSKRINALNSSLEESEGRNEVKARVITGLRTELAACTLGTTDYRNQIGTLNSKLASLSRDLEERQSQIANCADNLRMRNELVGVLSSRIDDAISYANTQAGTVKSIPSDLLTFSFTNPFDSEYEKLRKKYNSLVDRFNAAVERCNDLSHILSGVLSKLEGSTFQLRRRR